MTIPWYATQWAKRGYVALGALAVFALEQFARTGTLDIQALAGELAAQIKGITVGGVGAWLLTDRPDIMRPPSSRERDA